jgi:nucleotide-binding universal stress UspA family protein
MTGSPGSALSTLIPADHPKPWVVVGVDPSHSARLAIAWARDYVSATGGTLVACTAVPQQQPTFDDRPERVAALEERTRQELQAAGERIREILTGQLGEQGAAQTVEVVRVGGVADVLVGVADGADLLVIGATPRGRLGRALLGTIRPGVIGSTRCPVVVVPAVDDPA